MIEHRPFETLGLIERDWLRARLHFRFGEIGRPEHAPIGPLHIWNDDSFAPRSGFGMHAHRNVEIVTVMRSGVLTHEDSCGNTGRIEAGDVQVMSAGKGVQHAERNEEPEPARLFQIWLTPRSRDGEPRWAMRRFDLNNREGRFVVLASGDAADVGAGALPIDADARASGATLREGRTLAHPMPAGAHAYLATTTGRIEVDGVLLAPGDGAAIANERALKISALDPTTIVILEILTAIN